MKDDFRFKEPCEHRWETPEHSFTRCGKCLCAKPPYAPVELSIANAGVKQEPEYMKDLKFRPNPMLDPEGYQAFFTPEERAAREAAPQGSKHDSGKPDLSLVSSELMTELALVRQFGAAKYARDNWKLGFKYNRSIAAALRHIMAFKDGEDLDPESGLTHIGHAIASLEHLLYDYKHHKANDDRKT